jgi:hypothetical protein
MQLSLDQPQGRFEDTQYPGQSGKLACAAPTVFLTGKYWSSHRSITPLAEQVPVADISLPQCATVLRVPAGK